MYIINDRNSFTAIKERERNFPLSITLGSDWYHHAEVHFYKVLKPLCGESGIGCS